MKAESCCVVELWKERCQSTPKLGGMYLLSQNCAIRLRSSRLLRRLPDELVIIFLVDERVVTYTNRIFT